MSLVCLETTRVYGEKESIAKSAQPPEKRGWFSNRPSFTENCCSSHKYGRHKYVTDKMMLISTGINYCYNGGNNIKEMLVCGIILFWLEHGKWWVRCIVRQLYLSQLMCSKSGASLSSVAPSPSAGLPFLNPLCTPVQPSLAAPRGFLALGRCGELYKKVWMWVRLLGREAAFPQSSAVGCLGVTVLKWSAGNRGLCASATAQSMFLL